MARDPHHAPVAFEPLTTTKYVQSTLHLSLIEGDNGKIDAIIVLHTSLGSSSFLCLF